MNAPARLPRLPATPTPTSWEGLRETGLQALRALAGERWTDHNLHDPGITLLEAACLALADLGFRADFPVADLLHDADGRVDWAAHGLHLPEDAFPCRPTTAADLRRWVLDRVPLLDGVTVLPGAPGRLGLLLDAPAGCDLRAIARDVQRACQGQRALGEEVTELRFVTPRPCTLCGELELDGARDPVDVVAEFYETCAAWVAAAVDYDSCRDALARGLALDEVLDGPLTPNGLARSASMAASASASLSLAQLAEVARRVEGVHELRWLGLQPEGGPVLTTALPWRDPDGGWALALRIPSADVAWQQLTVMRRGLTVEVAADELARRCHELRAARLARRQGLGSVRRACPPPAGRHRPPPPFAPLAALLPPLYAVGYAGLPADATPLQRARARQLQGYLALLDPLLAHAGAQIDSLRSLFDTRADEAPSYRWQALGPAQDPTLAPLLDTDAASIVALEHAPLDPAVERLSRMLDSLLALHGQAWSQNSLRQFSDHLPPLARERHLLARKLAFARDISALSRDRAGGIDLSRPSWQVADNVAGVHRLGALLLGFPDALTRPLAADPQAEGLHLIELGLLQPLTPGVAAFDGVPVAWHALRLAVLLPDWTARARRPAFRAFAERTLQQISPAHLLLRCHWLAPETMSAIEALLQAWLSARVDWAAAPQSTAEVDAHAAALARALHGLDAPAAPAAAGD